MRILPAIKRSKPYRAVASFLIESANCVAPYTVQNSELAKPHFCWTWKEAVSWLKCYDASQFGRTTVYNFNGEPVAATY